jgi:hypothetical protein
MNRQIKLLVTSMLLCSAMQVHATDLAANATRDASQLVRCMKEFDAACTTGLTYTKSLEDHGVSREQLIAGVSNLYKQLKSMHANYLRFDLGSPLPPFVALGKTYIFIPYEMVLSAGGQDTSLKAFFIGVSVDSGSSWTFLDGEKLTEDRVNQVIPGYQGGPLPPVSMTQSASK